MYHIDMRQMCSYLQYGLFILINSFYIGLVTAVALQR